MPRIAKPRTHDAAAAARALHDYMQRSGRSGNALAVATDVSQSTISRFLSGRTKTITKAILPVLSYAGIDLNKCIGPQPAPVDNHVFDRLAAERPHLAALLANLAEAMLPALQNLSQTPPNQRP